MKIIKKLFDKYRQLITYIIIGGGCASIDYVIFLILTEFFGVAYLMANLISVNAGIITSFILNRNFNFKVKDKIVSRFVSFYFVGLLGLAISSLMLFVMIDILNYDKSFSKIVSIVVIAFIQFFLNKFITFKAVSNQIASN